MAHLKSPTIYWPELDGLRAIAFLFVFFSHDAIPASFPFLDYANKFCSWGWTGVDLFFVLSGFLITFLLFREKNLTGSISITRFYQRRALRIWPLYFLVLFVTAVFPLFIHHWNSQYRAFLADIIFPFLCFSGNYAMIWNFSTLSDFCSSWGLSLEIVVGLIVPLWSLCIEEQFYLFWPNLLKAARTINGIYFAIALCFLISLALKFYLVLSSLRCDYSHSHYYMDSFAHFESLMIGAFLGVTNYERPRLFSEISKRNGWLMSIIILSAYFAIFACAPSIYDRHWSIAPITSVTAVLFGMLLILSMGFLPLKKLLSTKGLTSIGKVSYAMYLFHLFIIRSFNSLVSPLAADPAIDWLLRTPVIFIMTWGAAQISWNLLEKRFLKTRMNLASVEVNLESISDLRDDQAKVTLAI